MCLPRGCVLPELFAGYKRVAERYKAAMRATMEADPASWPPPRAVVEPAQAPTPPIPSTVARLSCYGVWILIQGCGKESHGEIAGPTKEHSCRHCGASFSNLWVTSVPVLPETTACLH